MPWAGGEVSMRSGCQRSRQAVRQPGSASPLPIGPSPWQHGACHEYCHADAQHMQQLDGAT
eukprot:364741-Chlamydomonas_euryale.AAC.1